jgi:hypothetical protein
VCFKLFVTNLIGPCVVNLLTQISSSCASLCGPCAVKLFVTYPSERHRRLKCKLFVTNLIGP